MTVPDAPNYFLSGRICIAQITILYVLVNDGLYSIIEIVNLECHVKRGEFRYYDC